MKGTVLSRAHTVSSAQAAVFADSGKRRILAAFMAGERSLSGAADALDMPMNRLAYHVGALLRLGLLQVTRVQKRAGRPIRYYRAVADSFLVSGAAMGRQSGLAAELEQALERADCRAGSADLLLSVDEMGRPRIRRLSDEGDADAWEYWRVLALTRSEAGVLARELRDILGKYEQPPGRNRSLYLAHAALAPRLTS